MKYKLTRQETRLLLFRFKLKDKSFPALQVTVT